MKTIIVLCVALVLAACAPGMNRNVLEEAGATSAQTECAARGGRLEPVGRAQTLQCVIRYADADAPCQDGSACRAGRCLGPVDASGQDNVTGQCQATNMAFGCYSTVTNGRADAAICVD